METLSSEVTEEKLLERTLKSVPFLEISFKIYDKTKISISVN
jgi:hypothetical protein